MSNSGEVSSAALSIVTGPPITEEPTSLYGLLAGAVELHGNRTAVVSLHQTQHNSTEDIQPLKWTFQDLFRQAEKFARACKARGIGYRSPIATFLPSCAQFASTLWGAALLGAPLIPLDPRATARCEIVSHYLAIAAPEMLIVYDSDLVDILQENHSDAMRHMRIKLCLCKTKHPDWINLSEFFNLEDESSEPITPPIVDPGRDPALIIFTSGTTSLPKACPHTGKTLSSLVYSSRKWRDISPDRSILQHLPSSHMYALTCQLSWWSAGGAVVYPSWHFNPRATIEALEKKVSTDMPLVPIMFSALKSQPGIEKEKLKGLFLVGTGGSMISSSFIREARDFFSVKHAMVGFGMSEVMGFLGWHLHDDLDEDEDRFVNVGTAGYGITVKICEPGSRLPVARSTPGELHVTGSAVIDRYLGVESDSFYNDDAGLRWFTTGDQAKMNTRGAVSILGRYKDMIIRGGENLSPVAIEASLNKFQGLTSQVIGIKDDFAGEVPVAVIQYNNVGEGGTAPKNAALQAQVRADLGLSSVLASIFTLEDLGLESFPLTATGGKVMKEKLRKLVSDHMNRSKLITNQDIMESTASRLRKLWSTLLVVGEEDVPLEQPIENLADSLTLARLRGLIRREFGKDVAESKLNQQGGLKAQAQVLESITANSHWTDDLQEVEDRGLPEMSDLMLGHPHQSHYEHIHSATTSVLEPLDLDWRSDIENVYPLPSFVQRHLRRTRTWGSNLRLALTVTEQEVSEVIRALRASIKGFGTFRALAVDVSGTHYLAELRPTEKYYHNAFVRHDCVVKDETAFKNLARHGLQSIIAQPPGLLCKFTIVSILEPPQVGIVMTVNHAVFDAVSLGAWFEHFRNHIRSTNNIFYSQPLTTYKHFANLYHNFRTSQLAQKSADFYARRFCGIGAYRSSLWPHQRDPQWFIGNDRGSCRKETDLDENGQLRGLDGVTKTVRLPFLQSLMRDHGITASMCTKACVAIFLVTQTGQDTALFMNVQAGRVWPFVDPWLASHLPDPMGLVGSTHYSVGNAVTLNRNESLLSYLGRITEDQKFLTRYAHVSLSDIETRLDPEDKFVLSQMKSRINFNWLPPMTATDTERGIRVVQADRHFDYGVLLDVQLVNPETLHVRACYDGAQLSYEEMENHVNLLLQITSWVHNPENLDKSIGTCLHKFSNKNDGIDRLTSPFVDIAGVCNFRDIGGYSAVTQVQATGKQSIGQVPSYENSSYFVRRKLIFRSMGLSGITTAGIQALRNLGVLTLFDLRSALELKELPVFTGIQTIRTPVFDDNECTPEKVTRRYHWAAKEGIEGYLRVYDEILSKGTTAFRTIFKHILERPGSPFVVNCATGKDRTGVAIALILSIAGVDDGTIAREYSLTDAGLEPIKPILVAKFVGDPRVDCSEAQVCDMLRAREEIMVGTLEMMKKKYGGAEQYLQQELGFSRDDVEQIRNNLLSE